MYTENLLATFKDGHVVFFFLDLPGELHCFFSFIFDFAFQFWPVSPGSSEFPDALKVLSMTFVALGTCESPGDPKNSQLLITSWTLFPHNARISSQN